MPRGTVIDQQNANVATALAGFGQSGSSAPPAGVAAMVSPETLDYIKAQVADAVASGIDEGTKRVVEKYHLEDIAKWGKAAVFAQFVTAAAAVGILMTLLLRNKE